MGNYLNSQMSAEEKNSAIWDRLDSMGRRVRSSNAGKTANSKKNSDTREAAGQPGLVSPSMHNGEIYCPDCGAEAHFYALMEDFLQDPLQPRGSKDAEYRHGADYGWLEKNSDVTIHFTAHNGNNLNPSNGIQTEMWECGACKGWLFPVYVKIRQAEKPSGKRYIKGPNGELIEDMGPNSYITSDDNYEE